MIRHYTAILAISTLMLAGCSAPAEKSGAPAQSAASGSASPEAAAEPATTFICDNGLTVAARYATADGGDNVTLSISGKTYVLGVVPSASGSKYRTDNGMSAGKTLTWWSEGDGAMLIEALPGAEGDDTATTVNCKAQ